MNVTARLQPFLNSKSRRLLRFGLQHVVVGCALLACANAEHAASARATSQELASLLQTSSHLAGGTSVQFESGARRFYEHREHRPAWSQPTIAALLAALGDAESHGLSAVDYRVEEIMSALEKAPRNAAELDLLCTDAFLAYGSHLAFGKVHPESLEPDWRAARRSIDVAASLEAALESGKIRETLESLAPPHDDYERLREALSRYRQLSWAPIDTGGTLGAGAPSPLAAKLRQRLAAEGYIAATESDLFDEELVQALTAFQRSHGMEESTDLSKATLTELNIPAAQRAQEIALSLERWRWMPHALGTDHIAVNIPDYRVRLVENGMEALSMKGIVGKAHRRTPVFTGDLFEIVLNPGWGVPRRIAAEDKLPLIKKDPNYLAKNGFDVFKGTAKVDPKTINWKKLSRKNFPYQLRQQPGKSNALGRIKFNIHNDFAVYLHDSPDRNLFAEADRSFSSGCIRLEKPRELAARLLSGTGWDMAHIDANIRKGQTTRIKLKKPVPVHLQYFTAWVPSDDSRVQFRRDIYGRDVRLQLALDAHAL